MTRVPSLQATVWSSVAGFRYCRLSAVDASPFEIPFVVADPLVAEFSKVGDRVTPSSNVEFITGTFIGV